MPTVQRMMLSLSVVTAAAVSGCGPAGPNLVNVSGKATFAGKPIAYGLIEFIPDAEKGHKGPAGSAEIVGGQYDTAKSGRGILIGPHQLRITAYEERPPTGSNDETKVVEAKPPLFAGFKMQKDLLAGQHDIEVPESARGFDSMKAEVKKRAANEP